MNSEQINDVNEEAVDDVGVTFNDALAANVEPEVEPTMTEEEWQAMMAQFRAEMGTQPQFARGRVSKHRIARAARSKAKRRKK